MLNELSPADWTLATIGIFLLLVVIVVIRLVTRDRFIRRVRFGVFYERERDDIDDPDERPARKDDRDG